jgi:DNA-binding MarR family transcriptional regulator
LLPVPRGDATDGDTAQGPEQTATDLATLRVLRALVDGCPRPMSEIAARAMLLDATAARIVDRLARAGWIDRATAPDDPHRVLVRLTDHGRTRHTQHTHAAGPRLDHEDDTR